MDVSGFDSRRLHTFRVVAEEGTLTVAAKRLALSQPAVSQQIQQLEEAVGAPLFVREPRGVRLTPAGQSLLGHARLVESALQDAFAEVSRHRSTQVLRIGASTTVANHLLPDLLAEFFSAQGLGPVEMLVGNSRAMAEDVEKGHLSLAIIEGIPSNFRLETLPLEGDELLPIASASTSVSFADCQRGDTPLLWREVGSGTREVVEDALRREAGRSPRPTDLVFGSGESLYAGVLAGLGVGFVSELICGASIDAGEARVLDDVAFRVRRPFSWVLPSRGLSGRERAFFEWYRDREG